MKLRELRAQMAKNVSNSVAVDVKARANESVQNVRRPRTLLRGQIFNKNKKLIALQRGRSNTAGTVVDRVVVQQKLQVQHALGTRLGPPRWRREEAAANVTAHIKKILRKRQFVDHRRAAEHHAKLLRDRRENTVLFRFGPAPLPWVV